jgi:hypothetical protein
MGVAVGGEGLVQFGALGLFMGLSVEQNEPDQHVVSETIQLFVVH